MLLARCCNQHHNTFLKGKWIKNILKFISATAVFSFPYGSDVLQLFLYLLVWCLSVKHLCIFKFKNVIWDGGLQLDCFIGIGTCVFPPSFLQKCGVSGNSHTLQVNIWYVAIVRPRHEDCFLVWILIMITWPGHCSNIPSLGWKGQKVRPMRL